MVEQARGEASVARRQQLLVEKEKEEIEQLASRSQVQRNLAV